LGGFCVERNKIVMILFVVVLLLNIAITDSGAAATELIVHNGESIQASVNNSGSGDTIIVEPGIYKEHISTYIDGLIIMSQSGNPEDTIIQGSGFTIWTSNITIKGFTIKGNDDDSGIAVLDRTGECRIENNKILNYVSGIDIPVGSTLNIVSRNEVSNCQDGIAVSEGFENIVSNNKVSNCQSGITFRAGSGNIVRNNEISNCQSGITCMEGFDDTISNNEISSCGNGINIGNGDAISYEIGTRVEGNKITKNNVGISVGGIGYGYIIADNTISFNKYGYEDCTTGKNRIYNNYFNNTVNVKLQGNQKAQNIWNNSRTIGENIIGSSYIGGNYWARPAGDGFSQTHFDANGDGISEESFSLNGVNIDYLPLAVPAQKQVPLLPFANFSTNTTQGSAPLFVLFIDSSQYATGRNWDFENDGKADSIDVNPVHIYTVPGNYTVNLTVTSENGTDSKFATITVLEKQALPFANFSANTTQGPVPLSVQFTDLSENAVSWSWDFDNNGQAESSDKNPIYVYTVPGIYTINFTAINENGATSKLTTITVTEGRGNNSGDGGKNGNNEISESSEGSSHSHSGSDTGLSPEPSRNVETKDISQTFISTGQNVTFNFTKNTNCVVYLSFYSKTTTGKTTAIAEMLKGKSELVFDLPAGEIYKSFNVWVGNGGIETPRNIEKTVLCFKVEKAWIRDKKIDQDSIILNRCSENKWEQLPVNLLKEDEKFIYFTADIPGFSFFAITRKTNHTPVKTEAGITIISDNQAIKEPNSRNKGLENNPNESSSTPGFEIVYGMACLLSVFLYRKK
jgi:PGF-pre-PGF domain-containing protein